MINDTVDPSKDERPTFFGGALWYDALRPPSANEPSVWYLAKGQENHWFVQLTNAALVYARERGLEAHYIQRFRGIQPVDLTPARAAAEHRQVGFPIWQPMNELVVACYLERVLGWTFEQHEPPGHKSHRGDWAFSVAGQQVFVEVKTLADPDWSGLSGVFSRPDFRPKIRSAAKEAYKQLPDDQPTLVVLVAGELVSIPFGILHGDIASALFGRLQVTFPIGRPLEETEFRLGPSMRDRLVQREKHRRLGTVAGLCVRGLWEPGLAFYTIENPWAHLAVALNHDALTEVRRFVVDNEGVGRELTGIDPVEAWRRMQR